MWWSPCKIIRCFNSVAQLLSLSLPFTFKIFSEMMGFSCWSLLLFGTGKLLQICFTSIENVSDRINEIITLAESFNKSEFKIDGTLSNFIHVKWRTNFLHEENLIVSPLSWLKLWKRGTFISFYISFFSFCHFSNLESRSHGKGSSQSKFRFQHSWTISLGSIIHGAIKPSGS